jgi:hypothetical protein
MSKGIDCSSRLTAGTTALFAVDGITFAGRYYPAGMEKSLTRSEAENITASGIKILSVFERTAGRAGLGADAGAEDGALAFQAARGVGQPRWRRTSISLTVDYDAQPEEYPTIAEYFAAAGRQLPGYRLFAYAKRDLMEYLLDKAVIKGTWQPLAWGGSEPSPRANVWQRAIDDVAHGIGVDWNESYGNEGFWDTNITEPFGEAAAEKVIADLAALYMACVDSLVQAAAHYAAEALRGNPLPEVTFDQATAEKVIADMGALYMACADNEVEAASHAAADVLRDAVGIAQ